MDNYSLQPNESVLYKGDVHLVNENGYTQLLLTNLNFVFITKTKKIFAKEQVEVEAYPIGDIKIYNEIPQIKQNDHSVEIYLTTTEKKLNFLSKHEAHKFVNATYELLTGKSMSVRGADKVKSAVNLVDNTLGINTVNAVKNVMEKGVTGTVLGALGKMVSSTTKSGSTVNGAIRITKSILDKNSTEEATQTNNNTATSMSYDVQIETVKKLKELLDAGVLTQEEFDTKKKEILYL